MKRVGWGDDGFEAVRSAIMRAAVWLNPLTTSPSGALETSALFDSFGPSLMPRTSTLQGAATGLNLLVARGVAQAIELGVSRLRPADLGIGTQLATRAAVGLAGVGASALPRRGDERLTRAVSVHQPRGAWTLPSARRHRRSGCEHDRHTAEPSAMSLSASSIITVNAVPVSMSSGPPSRGPRTSLSQRPCGHLHGPTSRSSVAQRREGTPGPAPRRAATLAGLARSRCRHGRAEDTRT